MDLREYKIVRGVSLVISYQNSFFLLIIQSFFLYCYRSLFVSYLAAKDGFSRIENSIDLFLVRLVK